MINNVATIRTTNDERRVYCTLFNSNNEHLSKDVGLIPYGMCEFEGYDSFLATYVNSDYPNLKYTPGLHVWEIPKIYGDWGKDSFLWLRRNARKIDVLNVYHSIALKMICSYKFLNPHGKVYLKFDGAPSYVRPKNLLSVKLCDCVSTELVENVERLSKIWHREIICIPNPLNPNELAEFIPFSQRSDIVLYTGRIEKAKGSHILLEAFARVSQQIPNWSLKLVGTISEDSIVKDFRGKHPELTSRVSFTGNISDRQELIRHYRNAKIFVMPSRSESWGISLTEAMGQGCFAVTTNIAAFTSLTENFKYALGSDIDDIDGLARNILYACTHEREAENLALQGRQATIKRCDLKHAVTTIQEYLR